MVLRGRHVGFAALACVALVAYLALPCPAAHATYRDVADSYGTVETVDEKGDALDVSGIPDGTYSDIDVRTSSRFCVASNCSLTVSGGRATATFELSKSYTAVYLGTAAEAASKAGADGTDASAYVLGTQVANGGTTAYRYTLEVPKLNKAYQMATFNGGSQTFAKAAWYDRMVVFDASSAVYLAVASGKGSADAADGGGAEGDGGKSGENVAGKPPGVAGASSGGAGASSRKAAKRPAEPDAASVRPSGGADSVAAGSDGGPNEVAAAGAGSADVETPGSLPAFALHVPQREDAGARPAPAASFSDDAGDAGISPPFGALFCLALAALFAAGVFARAGMFFRQRRQAA